LCTYFNLPIEPSIGVSLIVILLQFQFLITGLGRVTAAIAPKNTTVVLLKVPGYEYDQIHVTMSRLTADFLKINIVVEFFQDPKAAAFPDMCQF
jgi:hypothetical protein